MGPYTRKNLVAANAIVQIEVDKPFKLLIANFGRYPVQVHKTQVVAQLLPHPTTITQGAFIIGEVLGIVDWNSEEQDQNSTGDKKKAAGSEESLKGKMKMQRIKKKRN